MRRIFIAPLLASLSLGGCIQMDTLPEVYARSQWKGRSAEEAIAFFGTPQNMERTRKATEEALQANQEKSRLLAQASHDLRQPIHSIGLFTACLRDARLGDEERRLVDNIDRSLLNVSRTR